MDKDPNLTQQPEGDPKGTEPLESQGEGGITDDAILAALQSPSDAVKAYLDNLQKAAVKAALAGSTPKKSPVKVEPITKEQFAAMSYKERLKLYTENREMYNKLTA